MEITDEVVDPIAESDRLGAEVNGHPENVPAVLPRLFEMLHEHSDPAVLAAVISAIGSAWDERACLSVLAFADHDDEAVRLAVARAAPGGLETDAAQAAVAAALIQLSRDAIADVRDLQ